MKKIITLIAIICLFSALNSCDSPGKKAAKEGMECIESAIDNASSLSSAQQAIQNCQENMKSKYGDKINSDPAFAKDFMESGKDWEKKIEEKLKAKFGSM